MRPRSNAAASPAPEACERALGDIIRRLQQHFDFDIASI